MLAFLFHNNIGPSALRSEFNCIRKQVGKDLEPWAGTPAREAPRPSRQDVRGCLTLVLLCHFKISFM